MKKILTAIMFVATAAFSAQAQTADEVIDKYYEVVGGKEAMMKLKNTKSTATVKVQGMDLPATIVSTADGKMKLTINFQGMEIIQPAFDGETGWQTNMQTMQPEKMDAEANKMMKDQVADFPDPFMNYKSKGYTATFEGVEAIDGTDANKIKLTKKPIMVDGKEEDNSTYYFFDKDSGVMLASKSTAQAGPMKGMTVEATMSDYQEVDGIYFPFSIQNKVNGQVQATIILEKVELNTAIDNAMFAFPK